VDLPAVAAAALAPASGVVVDVGCGPGVYGARLAGLRPDLRVAGVDLSAGMRPAVVADAVRLPFATGAAGAALAMHALYHVPDVPAAVAELRRVVAPGGVVVVSTNGRDDKPELGRLVRDVAAGPGGAGAPFVSPSEAFTAEDGDVLAQRFGDVRRQVFDRVVEVPEAQPVVAYVDSLRAWYEAALPPGLGWEEFVAAVRERVTGLVAEAGAFRVSTRVAVFTCR
jgi:SAM-dependent methyltransferase